VDIELTTPTGAALLKTLGTPRPHWPAMCIERLGYGAGSHDPEAVPNVLRLAVGDSPAEDLVESDVVWVLETNLDDMTGEEVGYCLERLGGADVLDVFTTPVQMKKNRPGLQLTVLCEPERLQVVERLLLAHTCTLGVRRCLWQRTKLARETRGVSTPWGNVRVKLARTGDGAVRCKPEYDDCRAIADAEGIALREVYRAALEAFQREQR
jgi:uncharacterized protein (DUF111 family)